MKVWTCGSPGHLGGASGECLGAIAIWRRYGLEVGAIPAWGSATAECHELAERYGFTIHATQPRKLDQVPDLAGAPVSMFCCDPAAKAAPAFAAIGCKPIAVPCMTFASQKYRHAAEHFHAWVCQSEFQKTAIKQRDAHVIRGGFPWWDVPFLPRPHEAGEPFVLGRVARGHVPKWSPQLYEIYDRVPNHRAILLGVSEGVARRLGHQPEWAVCHKPGDIPAEAVYRELHCYLTSNGEDKENWPRVGLEAMAYGVPIVAENQWGWREMIRHGETGFLYDTPEQASEYAALLANDEDLRLQIVRQARQALETELANPEAIWAGWAKVFGIDPGSGLPQPDARGEARRPAETEGPGFPPAHEPEPAQYPASGLPATFLHPITEQPT